MDPLYDSSSGAEDIKKKDKDEFSSDDEEEPNFLSKLGSILFMGCGGSKDTGPKKEE